MLMGSYLLALAALAALALARGALKHLLGGALVGGLGESSPIGITSASGGIGDRARKVGLRKLQPGQREVVTSRWSIPLLGQ
jgi:hypothetical protein